jgi:tRNA U34 5-carboxymethylaminomethyl modifying enzyme MnmG/GidA
MKIKLFGIKLMMIGSVTTGCFFCGQINGTPGPFELA